MRFLKTAPRVLRDKGSAALDNQSYSSDDASEMDFSDFDDDEEEIDVGSGLAFRETEVVVQTTSGVVGTREKASRNARREPNAVRWSWRRGHSRRHGRKRLRREKRRARRRRKRKTTSTATLPCNSSYVCTYVYLENPLFCIRFN